MPTAPCPDCHAIPCDCNDPIWTYWYKDAGPGTTWMRPEYRPDVREVVIRRREDGIRQIPSRQRGPVQRITDPPYTPPPDRANVRVIWDALLQSDAVLTAKLHALGEVEELVRIRDRAFAIDAFGLRTRAETVMAALKKTEAGRDL